MDLRVPLLVIDQRRVSIMSAQFTNRRMTHLRFDVVLNRYGIWNGVRILFGVSNGIQDITRSSIMVRRIRFIYRKSLSKFGNDLVH
jgi:hypothetical protein